MELKEEILALTSRRSFTRSQAIMDWLYLICLVSVYVCLALAFPPLICLCLCLALAPPLSS